jgi:hypothetical protein
MRDQRRESGAPVEPYFDRTPQPFGDGPPDPLVYDASPRMLRQRTLNFAAKRLVDMRYVSGLDRVTAERHFRWRPAVPPGGLGFRPAPTARRSSRPLSAVATSSSKWTMPTAALSSAGTILALASRLSEPR